MKQNMILSFVVVLGILLVGASNASANDIGTVPPSGRYASFGIAAASDEYTVDNGDGTFTYHQVIDEDSTAPHYTPPLNGGGFGIYSWYNQDYGWQHSFPYVSGMVINSASMVITAWDVDSEVYHGYDGEFDGVTGDGSWLNPQYLQGNDGKWSVTTFDVPASALTDGLFNVFLDIDMHHSYSYWATELDNSELIVTYGSGTGNQAPFAPQVSVSPACPTDDSVLTATVTGPNPADPDGDSVTYEYRWFVDTGTGFYVDDEFAGRGNHLGNTVPAADTQDGDKWRVQVTPVDEHKAKGSFTTVDFTQIGSSCSGIPEFPTIALPILSILGIMLLVSRMKRNK